MSAPALIPDNLRARLIANSRAEDSRAPPPS